LRITLPLLLVLGFIATGLVGGRREVAGTPDLIRIVSSLPRSGSARGQTDSIVNGIRLAVEDAGNKVEVADPMTGESRVFRLEYRDLDDATAAAGQWTIEQEIANANLARSDPDVMVYIGTYNSGAAKVSMPILNRARMLMVSPANTAEALTKPRAGELHEPMCFRPTGEVNFVRVVPTDDLQSHVAALWARDLGARRVYLLDDNEFYGKGIAAGFRRNCEKLGITILGHESIDTKAQEFTALMVKVKTLAPDLLYFAGTTESKGGQVLKDMIKAGLTCPMMAPDGCHQESMIESAGAESFDRIRFYATFGGLTVDSLRERGGRGGEFVRKYAARYGSEPSGAYAVYGYEAGLVALEAIRMARRKDRDAIRRAALGIRDFDGATGKWSFDPETGDTTNQTMSGSTVENGRLRFVRLLKRDLTLGP
jgi:branched-chain amino acid transport system substrate-binding protein